MQLGYLSWHYAALFFIFQPRVISLSPIAGQYPTERSGTIKLQSAESPKEKDKRIHTRLLEII